MKTIKKFDRSLGTSKREQGIVTPKDRNPQKHKEGVKHAWKRRLEMAGVGKGPRPHLIYEDKTKKQEEPIADASKVQKNLKTPTNAS